MNPQPDRAAWLLGGDASCSRESGANGPPLRIVLLGAPGVGKGTQAALLTATTGACQLSTGDIFRHAKHAAAGEPLSPAMHQALDAMHRGELVPDATVLALVTERIHCLRCPGGFMLDGFPRTVVQAEALDRLLAENRVPLDAVLRYELSLEELAVRIAGRRTCPHCKAVYHMQTKPPRVAGCCDHCGHPLVQREDDRPEASRVRLAVYEKSTTPLIDYYDRRHLLVHVDAHGTPEAVYRRSRTALHAHLATKR